MQALPAALGTESPSLTAGMLPRSGDSAEPCPRLTSKQLRAVSAQWRARAASGDQSAHLVADALNWVAAQRAKQEPPAIKVLAERISQWMGI